MGSIVLGLGVALFEAIDFKDGKILNSCLSAYRVPSFSDIPKIGLIIINRQTFLLQVLARQELLV